MRFYKSNDFEDLTFQPTKSTILTEQVFIFGRSKSWRSGLDHNTSGALLCAKTYLGLPFASFAHKILRSAIVGGCFFSRFRCLVCGKRVNARRSVEDTMIFQRFCPPESGRWAFGTQAFMHWRCFNKRNHWRYKRLRSSWCHGKSAVYQAPLPSRTLTLAPYWVMHGLWKASQQTNVPSSLTFIDEHAERHGLRFAIGGDVSAWDASWSEVRRDIVKAIDQILSGDGHAAYASST